MKQIIAIIVIAAFMFSVPLYLYGWFGNGVSDSRHKEEWNDEKKTMIISRSYYAYTYHGKRMKCDWQTREFSNMAEMEANEHVLDSINLSIIHRLKSRP